MVLKCSEKIDDCFDKTSTSLMPLSSGVFNRTKDIRKAGQRSANVIDGTGILCQITLVFGTLSFVIRVGQLHKSRKIQIGSVQGLC